jgi:hypothetical protein
MIMGASASSVWYNLQVSHPTKEAPVIDYKLALLFQPMLMLGITIGVELSVVFPYWLITVLIIILFIGACIVTGSCMLPAVNAVQEGRAGTFSLYSFVCPVSSPRLMCVWREQFLAGTSSRSFYKGILMWRDESRILVSSCHIASACCRLVYCVVTKAF